MNQMMEQRDISILMQKRGKQNQNMNLNVKVEVMKKYTLKKPEQNNFKKIDGRYRWYVVTETKYMYLRKSLTVQNGTGYDEEDSGYWETEDEALEASKQYYEQFLVFPAYYMYTEDGFGKGDILYFENKESGTLVYTKEPEGLLQWNDKIVVNDWSKMVRISTTDKALEYVINACKKDSCEEETTNEVRNSLQIQQERESDYGDAKESFDSIADFWSNYLSRKTQLSVELDAIDVATMMTLFKISRNAYKRKKDNFVDGESYANFGTRFFEENYETIS